MKSQFPILIPKDLLIRESEHIKGFESECFWVTNGAWLCCWCCCLLLFVVICCCTSAQTCSLDFRWIEELEVPLALRPTSETAVYYMFSWWVKSFRDLPLKVHQTCNVFRHETKDTRPLIRIREILWNEVSEVKVWWERK